jgi:F0F1-type ATP synthase gamma subunit
MKTLASLKKDLEFNKGLAALIEALKNISVTQYRILEQRLKVFKKLFSNIESFFELIDISRVRHPFLRPNDLPLAVVAITSDTGLLGGLNMQVINCALAELEKRPGKLIVIGERGKMYAAEGRVPFVAFPGIKDDDRYEQAIQLRDYCLQRILSGKFGCLKVAFPRPVSFTVQRVELVEFVPFSCPAREPGALSGYTGLIEESKIEDIVEYIIQMWIGQKFDEIMGLSRLAEFAARFVHLEASSQKLKETDSKTRLEYFRVRHELIDRNMRELFAARLLYAS